MSKDKKSDREILFQEKILSNAKKLLESIEGGDISNARSLIHNLNKVREDSLYLEIGKLTRELHETIKEIDVGVAEKEMPGARNKLSHVIDMCEEAANKTMDGIESTIPMSDSLAKEAKLLLKNWGRFERREMDVKEFKGLYKEMMVFLGSVEKTAVAIHSDLQEVLLAQNYQDLTGQAIKKVMDTVSHLEGRLVHLVAIAAEANKSLDIEENDDVLLNDDEIEAQIDEEQNEKVSGQDDVDDLLSSLGF